MDYARLSDEDLAHRFTAGDQAAFVHLVQRYAKPLFNFAYGFLGDYDDADDVAQQVLVQLYKSLPRARLDQPLRPWIYQIAKNKCLDWLRRRRPVLFSELEGDESDSAPALPNETPLPDELAERHDLQRLLREAIAALPPKYRAVVTMRYVNELPFAEIAAALDLPENTVKTHFQRAKGMLRGYLRGRL